MARICRVCEEKTKGGNYECEKCWKFYERAEQKFREIEKRKIEVGFDAIKELARHLKKLYEENPYCSYTGLEMMVEDRELKKRLKDENKLDELAQYDNELAVLGFSVDRELSKIGNEKAPYSKDNIVLCIRALNTMKGEFEPDAFVQACYQVLAYQVEKQTIFANDVLLMLRNFNARHMDKPVIPINEQVLKEVGYYDKDIEEYKHEYNKQIKAKHRRNK